MIDSVISRRNMPFFNFILLFLFLLMARVLTSRPQESHNSKNSINIEETTRYVRSYYKYHHYRTTQRTFHKFNSIPSHEYPKMIGKRSLQALNSNESMSHADHVIKNKFVSKENSISNGEKIKITLNEEKTVLKNNVPNDVKKYTTKPATVSPNILCLYKIQSVAISVTPSYEDDKNAQLMVENETFDTPGTLTEEVLGNGEVVQIEACRDPKASCYTLWRQDSEGNITVLGQGCWKSSQKEGKKECDVCTRVTPRLPATKFCCCTKSYCNADYTSLKEAVVTEKAQLASDLSSPSANYTHVIASAILMMAAILVLLLVFRKIYCKRAVNKDGSNDEIDAEKGDVMGTGPDGLATGLLCVDNLALIEHIGQGKFGSVWRGSLGSSPVAVKLYSSAAAWQRESQVYCTPHLAHPNILRYYGSECRESPSGGREWLIVTELCSESLRSRLRRAPLAWHEFARLAHGLAAALAHLHTPNGSKPCIVHRDINSNNVLVCGGNARLADLGLAHALRPKTDTHTPITITEAGTLRYLSPEALEGALDLSGARAALCAVDVYALALVLWEALWRTVGAHGGPTPPYVLPYQHHGLPNKPTLSQMQNLVSRKKARPPLPKGPVIEARALKIASDTCDESWDHDAEARLTAVCVEERMAELGHALHAAHALTHDNLLHPDAGDSPHQETDKNSNCVAMQSYDVTTPLLYPDAHIGRNACIQRNTHTNTEANAVELVHKSIKDILADESPRIRNVDTPCLSMARVTSNSQAQDSQRINDARSYQRPLEYVQNDVGHFESDKLKETNLIHDARKQKWSLRSYFNKKLGKDRKALETEVKLVADANSGVKAKTKTLIVGDCTNDRPNSLAVDDRNVYVSEACVSPPNRTLSPNMMLESDHRLEKGFKELPFRDEEYKNQNQIFAVIVPRAKLDFNCADIRNNSDSMDKSAKTSMSSSVFKSGNSESEDSAIKHRLSVDNRIINESNSACSSRASVNLELQYLDRARNEKYASPFENTDCSSSEDDNLMLLAENGGSKITMQSVNKLECDHQIEVLQETGQTKRDFVFNAPNKYISLDNETSDPQDKENLKGYSVDNPVYLATLNGEIDSSDVKLTIQTNSPAFAKSHARNLLRQHSLEQVSELFASNADVHLQNPAGRVKTPGDLPVAIRKARRDRALQGKMIDSNRLSLYDDRMMFGNSL